jgi:hypothetical protein
MVFKNILAFIRAISKNPIWIFTGLTLLLASLHTTFKDNRSYNPWGLNDPEVLVCPVASRACWRQSYLIYFCNINSRDEATLKRNREYFMKLSATLVKEDQGFARNALEKIQACSLEPSPAKYFLILNLLESANQSSWQGLKPSLESLLAKEIFKLDQQARIEVVDYLFDAGLIEPALDTDLLLMALEGFLDQVE